MSRFILSRADRRALLAIEWLAVLAFLAAGAYVMHRKPGRKPEQHAAADSLHSTAAHKEAKRRYIYAEAAEHVETFPFDPNTADSATLLRLGLPPAMVRRIYRYRAQHGRFHTPEDFRRLYGMTYELWERLGPQIRIDRKYRYIDNADMKGSEPQPVPSSRRISETCVTDSTAGSVPEDSTASSPTATPEHTSSAPHAEKYPPGTLVDINTADTAELKRIPGIASFRAGKIVAYREALGGFVDTEQAMEACELPDEVLAWFTISATVTRKVNVNKASVRQMMHHPYISFYMARDIVEYRRKNKRINSMDELVSDKVITSETAEKLAPYLEF